VLKPASYLGVLCSGPNRGQKVTFVRPADWLGDLERMDPDDGWRRVCRRYVHAYGPATHLDIAAWWGAARAKAKHALGTIASELTQVDVEGRSAWALTADVDAMSRTVPPTGSVRLLPGFDTYVMGAAPRTSVVPEPFKPRVSRTAGWISPVVLRDGVAVGVWRAERSRDGTTVLVEAFEAMARALRSRVEREARRMEPIIGPVTDVRFEEVPQGGVAP
jgi:uncharacterized protein YcaQ